MKEYIFKQYLDNVLKYLDITTDDLFEDTKKTEVVRPRQMLYYLCMERPIRVSYIQRFMSEHGCDVFHSTIIHGYKKAKKMVEEDEDYKAIVNTIELQNLKV